MIKKLFSGQINNITIAALLIALSSLVSRLLGIFRDRILAGEFGAGETLDIYYAAFRIPDLFFNLLVLGALSAGFIPIFTAILENKKESLKDLFNHQKHRQAWLLVNNILNILVLALVVLCGLGFIFAPWLTKLIAPGFSQENQALAAGLTRIMFFSPLILGISSVFGGVLQSFKRFFIYSLSPIVYNIGIIIGALYFVPLWGIKGLAWGVVFGALLHALIQLPTLFKLGYRYAPIINLKSEKLRLIGKMMIPRTLSLAVAQLNFLVVTIVASTLPGGSLTIFNLANNLQSFPIGIFGISFAVAAFPALSALAFKRQELVENFSQVFRNILFFIVPATVLLLTLRAQIIRVVLGTGLFSWQDTILTLYTLGFFSISLFAQATIPLMIRVFYARHDSKTPFIMGLISLTVNIGLCLWLPKIITCVNIIGANNQLVSWCAPMGARGLALAFSIASIVYFVLLWLALKLEIKKLDEKRIVISTLKFVFAAIGCGLAVQAVKFLIWPFVDMTKVWGVFAQGFTAGVAGIISYFIICYLLNSQEWFYFAKAVKKRLPWHKVETGDQGEARGI